MNHRRGSWLAVLALSASALAGCSSSTAASPGDGDSDGPTVLRFQLSGGPEEQEAYQTLAEAFHEEHPDTTIELAVVARQDDLLARLTSAFAAGNPPDLFLVNFRKYGLFASQGVLSPVQPLLDASTVLSEGSFYQAPLDAFRFDGTELACMPQNVSSLVTYVNLDLFEAAGISPPEADWTWDEFLLAARALTSADVHGIGTDPSLIRLAPMIWSNGGDVVDDQLAPTRLTLDTPEAGEALDFLLSLQQQGVAPDDLAEQARDSESRFLDGTLGMYWSSRKDAPTFRTIEGFAWDVVPFPIAPAGADGTDGERVTMLHADAFCLPAAGQVGKAWEFVEFAVGPIGGAILAESGRTVPINRAVAESEAFLRTDVPPAHARVFLDNAEIVRATPSTAGWSEVEGQADDILEQLWFGRITRDEAMSRFAALQFAAAGPGG